MSVVIDASALVAFVTNEPAAPKVSELIQRWGSQGTEMNAPVLARYEIANALTKQAATGNLSDEALDEAWDILDELPVVYHPLRDGPSVMRAALTFSDAPPTTPRISLSPKTWKPSYGRSMAHSPATQAHAATESI